jgi:hypothetical protein
MSDRSTEVIWGLTKRFNCHTTKWNGKQWSHSPFSTNGFNNASQSANTIGITVRKEATTKNFKRTFTMTLKKDGKHGIKKNKKTSQGNPATSVMDVGRDAHHAAKAILAQRPVTTKQKTAALKKLARLARSTRSAVKGVSKSQ